MSAKELILEFLNLIFILILASFCIVFFIAGDNFETFTVFLQSMVPLAIFGIFFLIKIKITRNEIKKKKSESNIAIVLYLNVFHKLFSDIIVFILPILLGFLIYKTRGVIDKIDIVVLSFMLLVMFFWQRYLFKQEG